MALDPFWRNVLTARREYPLIESHGREVRFHEEEGREEVPGALSALPHHIASKIDANPVGCWPWTGATSDNGYGNVSVVTTEGRRTVLAHRVVYELLCESIPDGMVIDHLCRNRRCVRPDHLSVVTQAENVKRGAGPELQRSMRLARTECKNGHPFSGDNVMIRPDGSRRCRQCNRDIQRRAREARRH